MVVVFFDSPEDSDFPELDEPGLVVVSVGPELERSLDNGHPTYLIHNETADEVEESTLEELSGYKVVTSGAEWDTQALSLCSAEDFAILRWDDSERANYLLAELFARGTRVLDLNDDYTEIEQAFDAPESPISPELAQAVADMVGALVQEIMRKIKF